MSIAGSDTCAGAGIQQDLKTITAMGCYGATVITAITSQNTLGVQGVMPISAVEVRRQIFSVLDDLDVKAVKIGMRRAVKSGSPGDTDVYGAQQHAPLLGIQLDLK